MNEFGLNKLKPFWSLPNQHKAQTYFKKFEQFINFQILQKLKAALWRIWREKQSQKSLSANAWRDGMMDTQSFGWAFMVFKIFSSVSFRNETESLRNFQNPVE